MAATRRDYDGLTTVDRAVAILRDEMRVGFERIDARIDTVAVRMEALTERVTRHGEVLAAHRARDPRDVDPTSVEPRWSTTQLTSAAAFAATAVVVLLEVLRWFSGRLQ